MRRVLLTGGAGYLGSVLSRELLARGYAIRCWDRLLFGAGPIAALRAHPAFELMEGDIADAGMMGEALDGVDAVIHLAGLANDPSCDLEPEATELVNYHGTVALAEEAAARGAMRFVFASSCSVYGAAGDARALDETAAPNPVSLYACCKRRAEEALARIARAAPSFEPVILRQPTLFGISPRMRFDLAVHAMTLDAVTRGRVEILGGGEQWRPFVHVCDAASAFMRVLEAPAAIVRGEIFNAGGDALNVRIGDLARQVAERVNGARVETGAGNGDLRSYHVAFGKMAGRLEWRPERTIESGIQEVRDALTSGAFPEPDHPRYYNVRTLKRRREIPAVAGGEPSRRTPLPFALPELGVEEEQEVLAVLRSGWLTTGARTERFERLLAEYTGASEVVAVSSCTAALHLALTVLDIGDGDEVITTPVTWPSTANVIEHRRARPVFVDVDPGSLNMDAGRIEEKITGRTRAILPVHMAGLPVDLERIRAIASRHGLPVIEDAAHALGAEHRGRRIGSISPFTCFSFYPIKNITTGEGGAVAIAGGGDSERLRRLALHGVTRDAWQRYTATGSIHWDCVEPGYKYNMPDLAAALGIHQLAKLDRFIERRAHLAAIYREALADVPEIVLPPPAPGNVRHAHHLFIVQIDPERLTIERDRFVLALRAERIGTGIHFRGLHLQSFYREKYGYRPEDFPHATRSSERIVSLPLYPKMTDADAEQVAAAVRRIARHYRR